jgi:hypothetical protein
MPLAKAEAGQRSSDHLQNQADKIREITAGLLELAK